MPNNTSGKLVNNQSQEIYPIERGTVESAIGTITYVKKGKIITYTANFNAYNAGATTSRLGTVPFFNSNERFVGGAIMRVGDVPVNFGALIVTENGAINAIHMNYGNQVEFIGSVTVILE